MSEKIRYILTDWFESKLPAFIPRDISAAILQEDLVFSLVGVRRAGKTFSFFQMIDELKTHAPSQNIIYINFEDDRLFPLEGNELKSLLEIYRENFNFDKAFPIFLFLDEVQNIDDWERTVRRFYDRERNVRIAITGSSSKLLSSEIATSLRGRTLSKVIYPLSFFEFLKFKNIEVGDLKTVKYSPRKNEILLCFNEYIECGGSPKVVLSKSKSEILREYYRAIFYRDIVERYEIRNIRLFENFMKLVIQSMSSLFSFGKIANTLSSIGFKVSKNTLIEYMKMLEAAFLAFAVPVFSYTVKDHLQYPRKIYIIDNGLRNSVCFRHSEDKGKLLENLVFLNLIRTEHEIFYWTNTNGYQVVFVIKKGEDVIELIQVCSDVTDLKTRKREERTLLKAMEMFKLKEGKILTLDYEQSIDLKGKMINYEPVWYWLLKNEQGRN